MTDRSDPIVGAPGPAPDATTLPTTSAMLVRDCGCWFVMNAGDPPVSEFTCEHGYFVGRDAVADD